ncbi:MAG: protein phosphatase 2C domain-containing protein [Butyrivibrio sp.]|nr:protein phosphatase 2C domain-containing protein [Butyrivibrio sp.]
MTGGMPVLLGISIVYAILFLCRCLLGRNDEPYGREADAKAGIAQTTGSRQVQADVAQIWMNRAGTMAVLADGIGSANTGIVCAQIAVDTILDRFEPYQELNDPIYFFKSAFGEANRRIQKTAGERRGGASVGVAFLNHSHLYYAVTGNVRIAILRGEEIIPLSKGQTIDVLAAQAYEDGKISRQDTLWSMEEKRVWNYLGQDGFREIEICDRPILLKRGDKVLLMSKGIFEEISWSETEDILIGSAPLQELAERMVDAVEQKKNPQADNGSVILLQGLEA